MLGEPHVILGKKGITKEFINHILKLLKRYKIIKIKILRSIATKSNIKILANEISKLTNSHILDIRGKICVLSLYEIKKLNLKKHS
ncbi:MAG: YhbY family RNA-binding protein [Candidatus Hodarchaeota archaeon]